MVLTDTAFVDRADIIQYVDLPPREAIYDILRSSLREMASKGVVAPIVCHLRIGQKLMVTFSEHPNAEAGSDIRTCRQLSKLYRHLWFS
jgi:SpoVK/Ycf46/Vps4 family AAA+-type ATPase